VHSTFIPRQRGQERALADFTINKAILPYCLFLAL
jgi:hypothetical protein